jgi:NADPH-dependent 2,4-dienoyl-CoA reductase/sulfur reductase-like enzyme
MMTRRILVIGGLAAGPSAASKAARTNPGAEVVLFEQGESISYGICEIPYYIAGEVRAEGLVAYTPETLKKTRGVDARILHRVEEIIPRRRTIVVRDLKTSSTSEERYDRLVIAAGSRPRILGLKGEQSRNVFHVKSLEEGYQIRKYIDQEKPAKAVILGGGYIGMEMADALRARGIDVTLLHNHELPMSGLEPETSEKIKNVIVGHRVRFVPNARTQGFVCDAQQKVTHVLTDKGSFETDLVILALGVLPNSELASRAGIRIGAHGGILTDRRQQTSIDNIYAAGDCCEVKNLVNNQWMYIPLATIASRAGWTAGENAAGGKAVFRGAIRAVAIRIFEMEVAHVGLNSEEAKASGFDVATETITAWSRVAVMPGSKNVVIKAIADRKSHRLLGANAYGEEGAVLRANTLAVAIQHRITIDDIQQWDLAYSPPFTPLWDPILVAANATQKKLLA